MKYWNNAIKIAALLAAALIISGCGGAEQRKVKYLEKGKAYIEQQNFDKAKIELKNVLQIDPKQAEAYYLLGLIEEQQQNWQQAFGLYSKALDLNTAYMEPRAKLGRLFLLAGNIDKATEMMEAILAKQPDNTMGKSLKIAIMAKKGDIRNALQMAEELVKANPAEPDPIDLLASLYLSQQNEAKAIELLSNGVLTNPKNIAFRMLLAQLYLSKHDYEKAETLIQEIIRIEPDKLQYRVVLSSFYTQQNQLDKAEKVLRDAIEADPEDTDRYLILTEFLAVRKSLSAAETELLSAIKAKPKHYKLRFGLAALYEKVNASDKAAGAYRDIIDADDTGRDGLVARDKLANLLLLQGKQKDAETLINQVLKENPQDHEALIVQGKLALHGGRARDAITSFRSVLRDQPNSVDVLTLLAGAHILNKEPELAKENLFQAVELNPLSARAKLALAQFLASSGDLDGSLKKIDEALKVSPNDLDVLQAKVKILDSKKDTKGLKAVLVKIQEAHPDKSVGYYLMGKWYMNDKKYDDAIQQFELAVKKSSDNYQSFSAITSVNLAQQKPKRAVERLMGILRESPNHPFAHGLLAEVYISTKRYADAERELHEAIKASPGWSVSYGNLANVHLARGESSAAEAAYQQGLKAIPDDPLLLYQMAEFYERTHNFNKAIDAYDRLLKTNPDNDIAASDLASLLTDHRDDAAGLKRAKELAGRFESSPQPAFRDTLGWVYYKLGELDKAIPILKNVVKQSPSIPVFQYHLGMAYFKKGDLPQAKVHLAKAVAGEGNFFGIDEARAVLKQVQ